MNRLVYRPRRLRQNKGLLRLVRQARLSVDNLIMPLFVRPGRSIKRPISSMPGNYQLSVDNLVKEVRALKGLGIPAVMLFGIPDKKDESASGAYAEDGIVQQACRAIKQKAPGMMVICDVCLCEYTLSGHCGLIKKKKGSFEIDNDATLELLARAAVSQGKAGADMVAPSAMMDGQVKAIRKALDASGQVNLPIMAYSAKYASGFYGPFRQAAESPPKFGDRKSYQMDKANAEEALREVGLDIKEGADIVMVKPALSYLDIIRRVKEKFDFPLAAYNVSGEFSMVKAAASKGWLSEKEIVIEILTSIIRAGADMVITYHAKDAAGWLLGE